MSGSSSRARWSVVLGLGLGLGLAWGCDADLRELRGKACLVQYNGICDEGTICSAGQDRADCVEGPYRVCHTLVNTYRDRHCQPYEFCVPFVLDLPIQESVCSPACEDDADCPQAEEDGLTYQCRSFALQDEIPFQLPASIESDLPRRRGCVIRCNRDADCMEGMDCSNLRFCVWRSPI